MSENFWTFCLFATYPKKLTTYPFFMVGIAFVVYLLDILDLQELVYGHIKNDINILCIMYILSTHMLYIACTDNIATMPCRYCKIQL